MATWIWATDANAGPAGAMTWLVTAPTSYASGWLAPYTPVYSMASVQVTSVPDMVTKVLAAAGSDKIERLILYGHAFHGAQAVGCGPAINLKSTTNDFLAVSASTGTLTNGAEHDLARLVPQLAPNARVSLGGCNIAAPPDGQALLIRISTALGGITVEGGTWTQTSLFPGYEGPVVRCTGNSCTTIYGPSKEIR